MESSSSEINRTDTCDTGKEAGGKPTINEERGEDSTGPGQKPQVGDIFHWYDILHDFSRQDVHASLPPGYTMKSNLVQ